MHYTYLKYVKYKLIADRFVLYISYILGNFVLDGDLFVQHKIISV